MKRVLQPISNDVATVATVAGAVVKSITALPLIVAVWVFKASTAYLKINGTRTFRTLAPTSKPTAILTLCRISGSSYKDV